MHMSIANLPCSIEWFVSSRNAMASTNQGRGPEAGPRPGKRSAVPVQFAKTEAPLIEPGKDDGRGRRLHIPGRHNLLKVGTVLQNRFRVLDIRGVGGMSTVYKSRDLRFTSVDRLCAIKEMFNSAEDAKLRQVRL